MSTSGRRRCWKYRLSAFVFTSGFTPAALRMDFTVRPDITFPVNHTLSTVRWKTVSSSLLRQFEGFTPPMKAPLAANSAILFSTGRDIRASCRYSIRALRPASV